jgi:hypothetical protein
MEEKLVHIPGKMKTTARKKEAKYRWDFLVKFREQWEMEAGVRQVLED